MISNILLILAVFAALNGKVSFPFFAKESIEKVFDLRFQLYYLYSSIVSVLEHWSISLDISAGAFGTTETMEYKAWGYKKHSISVPSNSIATTTGFYIYKQAFQLSTKWEHHQSDADNDASTPFAATSDENIPTSESNSTISRAIASRVPTPRTTGNVQY